MSKHKISISLSSNYNDVYEFLKTKPNVSNYVCEVIREKINTPGNATNLENKIEEIVNRLLKEKNVSVSNNTVSPNSTEVITSADMDLIKNLF
jgi:hypothetical protein